MIKMLIADDEPEFRDYLVHLTDWKAYGIEICGQARNGKEAIELAASQEPDIALLDINMPLMDGLRVAEHLKSSQADILIALVTGYSEFEYARRAIKLGIEDYVLKPFKKDELLSTLLKFKVMIHQRREEAAQAKDDLFLARERLLNVMLSEEYDWDEEEFIRFFQKQDLRIHSGHYVVVSVEIDNMYQLWMKPRDIALWKFAVSNVLGDVAGSSGAMLIFNGPEGRIVAIHPFDDRAEADKFELEGYRRLCAYVKTYFRFTVTVGISRPVSHLREIRSAYLETVIALQNKLIAGNGGIFLYEALNESGKGAGFNSMKWNEELLSALRRNNITEANQALLHIHDYIRAYQLPVDFTYAILMGIVSLCLSHITEMGGDIEQVLGSGFRPYQQIKKMTSLEDSFHWLTHIFGETIAFFQHQKVSRALQIVRDVQEHIEKHYADSELSVEHIARHFHLDSSYIRKAFSRELNVNVAEYMTQVRLTQAKLLMETSDMKLHELSEKVGYSDSGYFSKVFKKHCDMLPSEYMVRARKG